jgi:hypothetical protein
MDPKKNALRKIGERLREEARDIVEAQLPARLAELLRQLERSASRTVHLGPASANRP